MDSSELTDGPVIATHQGMVRQDNQDSSMTMGPVAGAWEALLIIADGMGGHAAGKEASAAAVDALAKRLVRDRRQWDGDPASVTASIERGFAEANSQVQKVAHTAEEGATPGTTLTCAILRGGRCYIGHVGDCRALLISTTEVDQATEDQTWVAEQVRRGVMTPEEALRSPYRSQLLQALGTRPEITPAVYVRDLAPRDVVLLCTDGLSGYMGAAEIAGVVRGSPDLGTAMQYLVRVALERGGEDNVTIVSARAREGRRRGALVAAAGGRETLSLPVAATPARRGHAGYSRWVGYLLIAAAVLVGGLAVLVWRGPADAPGADRSSADDRPGPPVTPTATPTDGGGVAPDQPGPTPPAPTGPVAAVQVEVSLQPDGPLVLELTGAGARLRGELLAGQGGLRLERHTQLQYTFREPESRKALVEGRARLEFAGPTATTTWIATQSMAQSLTVGGKYTVSFVDASGSTELFTVTATATEPAGERSAAAGASRQERTLPDSGSDRDGVSDRSAGRDDRHRPQL